jgi:hypothetical protein
MESAIVATLYGAGHLISLPTLEAYDPTTFVEASIASARRSAKFGAAQSQNSRIEMSAPPSIGGACDRGLH